MDKKTTCTFAYLILLFLFVRLMMLLFADFSSYWGEYYDLYPGMIAKEIIENKIFAPSYWQRGLTDHGGTVVCGYITVPFFILFGKSLFSLRMVALMFDTISFAMMFIFLNSFFNKRITIISSLLYIFPSIFFFIYSSRTIGNHTEIIVFNMSILYLFYKIFYQNKRDFRFFILLGLVSGFGTYFLASHFFILLVLLFFWYIFDRRMFLKRDFYIFLLSFLVGVSPWIMCYFEYILRFNESFQSILLSQVKYNFPSLLTNFLNEFIFINKSLSFSVASDKVDMAKLFPWLNHSLYNIYFALFLIAYFFLLWKERRSFARLFSSIFLKRNIQPSKISPSLPILIYPILFALFFGLISGGATGVDRASCRYLLPLHPFIFIIIAIFLDILWQKRLSILSRCCVIFLICIFIFVSIPGLHQKNMFQLFKMRGYGYHLYFRLFRLDYWPTPKNLERYLKVIKNIKKPLKPDIYFGLAYCLSKREVMPNVELMEDDYLPFFYISLGWHNKNNYTFLNELKKEKLKEMLNGKDSIFYFEGLGADLDINRFDAFMNQLYSEELKHKIHMAAGFNLCLRGRLSLANVKIFDERYKNDVYKGMGWCYGAMKSFPADYRYVQYLRSAIEWIECIYRARYSAEWKDIEDTVKRLPINACKYFWSGSKEGEMAMARLLEVCELNDE